MTTVRKARPFAAASMGQATVPPAGGRSTRVPRVELDWVPPEGMLPSVVANWKSFYRAALRTYGVSPQFYRDMYVAQHGCCYICRKAVGKNPDDPKGGGGRRLGIDHNHVTGVVRGLLCTGGDKTCNRIIGWLDLAALKRAVKYVETEPAQTVRNFRADMSRTPVGPADMDDMLTNLLGLG